MISQVVPLDQLAALSFPPEIIVATDRGANVYGAAAMLRDQLRSMGFASDRASYLCHMVNLIMGVF
jgi:hypothetical protein